MLREFYSEFLVPLFSSFALLAATVGVALFLYKAGEHAGLDTCRAKVDAVKVATAEVYCAGQAPKKGGKK